MYETVEKKSRKISLLSFMQESRWIKFFYKITEVPTEKLEEKRNTKVVDLTNKMFDEIAPKYADRKGGYTRIVKIGLRKGDAAMEVLLELI